MSSPSESAGQVGGINIPGTVASVGRDIVGRDTIHIINFYRGAPAEAAEPVAALTEAIAPCPYPGLSYFGPNDAALFFGRDAAIERLTASVTRRSFTALVGASGSGKSSVVLAGFAPRLAGAAAWRFSYFRIGNELDHDPFMALARALVPLFVASEDDVERLANTKKLASRLQSGELALRDVFSECRSRNKGSHILLIADQFEEAFTLVADDTVRHRFVDVLLTGFPDPAAGANPDICLILTLRADFYGRALLHRPLADALQNHVENLGPMKREELQAAIVQPADNANVSFEPSLVETLLDEVERKPGSLPLLQFALREMWGRQKKQTITRKSYDAIGGVQGALALRAETIFAKLTDNGANAQMEKDFRRLFTRLVALGEGQEDTRRVAERRELGDDVWSLAQRLAGESNRLVVTDAPAPSHETAEVVHEALIRHWPKLADWINRDRAFLSWLRQIKSTMDLWLANQTDEGLLLRGGMLAQATDWLARRSDDLGPAERAYIEASIALRRRAEEEKEAAQQAELRKEKIARRTLARWIMVVGAFFVIAVAASIFATLQWQSANKAAVAANKAEHDANTAKDQAQAASDTAHIQLLAMQARRADTDANTSDDIGLAGALALESIALAHGGNRAAEADALEAAGSALSRLPLVVLTHGDRVYSLAGLSDGRLASGGNDGKIKLWPKDGTGEPVVLTHGDRVSSLAVLADGRLASGGDDGKIKLWPKDGTGEPVVLTHGGPVSSLAVLSDGRLASGGNDGKIKLWPKDGTGEPVVLTHGNRVKSLAVLSDGRLASGGDDGDGKIKLWPKDGTGEPVVLTLGRAVFSLAVLSDGRLASGGFGPNIKLWPKDGTGEPVVLTHGGPVSSRAMVSSLAVLLDGRLASGGNDGKIKLWPKDGRREPVVLTHDGPVSSLAVLSDGRLASGGEDGTIKLWPKDGTGEPVVLTHGNRVQSLEVRLAVLSDGRLASSGNDGTIKLWPKDGTGEPVVLTHGNRVQSLEVRLAVLSDGRLASGGNDGTIKLWPKDGRREPVVLTHGGWVQSLAVLSDGRLASGGNDGTIKLWPKDGTGEPVVLTHGGVVSSLAVLSDGRLASVGGDRDGKIKLWPKDGTGEPVVLTHGGRVYSLAVLSDGRLASGDNDGEIKLWPKDGTGEPVVLTHGNRVQSLAVRLAVLSDGRLASGGNDGKIKLWPKDGTGEPVVLTHGGPVSSLAVLSDGRLASVGGNRDGKIKLWPKDGTGEPVVLTHGGLVSSLAMLSDGRLASGGDDGKIKLWLVQDEKLFAVLCLRAGRNLSKDEWARYIGPNTPWQPTCRNRASNWRTPD